jgi:hypothetical protein
MVLTAFHILPGFAVRCWYIRTTVHWGTAGRILRLCQCENVAYCGAVCLLLASVVVPYVCDDASHPHILLHTYAIYLTGESSEDRA